MRALMGKSPPTKHSHQTFHGRAMSHAMKHGMTPLLIIAGKPHDNQHRTKRAKAQTPQTHSNPPPASTESPWAQTAPLSLYINLTRMQVSKGITSPPLYLYLLSSNLVLSSGSFLTYLL